MSKVRALTIAVVMLVLLNVALVAFVVSHGGPPPRPEGPKKIIIERLHFDAEQVAAYDQAITTHQEKIKEKEQEAMRLRNELYAKLQQPATTGADSIATAIGAVQAQIEMIHYNHFKAIEAICKPEQQGDFIALSHDLTGLFREQPPDRKQ